MIYRVSPSTKKKFRGFSGWKYPKISNFDYLDSYIKSKIPVEVNQIVAPERAEISSILNQDSPIPPILMKSRGTWIVSEEFKDHICKVDRDVHVFKKIKIYHNAKVVMYGYWLFVGSATTIPFDFEKTEWSGGHKGASGAEKAKFSVFGDIHLLKVPHPKSELFRGQGDNLLMAPYFCTELFFHSMPDEVRAGLDIKCCRVGGERTTND